MRVHEVDQKKIENRLLLSRLLTRSGDQAWDFAVPLVLIELFPQQLNVAILYFFLIKLGSVLLTPYVGQIIDRLPRLQAAKIGIGSQVASLVGGCLMIMALSGVEKALTEGITAAFLCYFLVLTIFGLVSQLGATVMEIAVANDIVPTVIEPGRLGKFNSRLRQLDLFTEVTSPLVAGFLLLIAPVEFRLLGFSLIALWNVLSFYPEYALLKATFRIKPELLLSKPIVPLNTRRSLLAKLTGGWKEFALQPIAPVIFFYSLLWLSALSPHGVLLVAFLKGGWEMSEITIGAFRALGAGFGLAATVIFPMLLNRWGLLSASRSLLFFQAAMVLGALICFFQIGQFWQYGFLVFILFSRIGLYGFSLGETQLRQISIPEGVRGQVNGVGSALNNSATLILFGLGTLFSSPRHFLILVLISVGSVVLAALGFAIWSAKRPRHSLG